MNRLTMEQLATALESFGIRIVDGHSRCLTSLNLGLSVNLRTQSGRDITISLDGNSLKAIDDLTKVPLTPIAAPHEPSNEMPYEPPAFKM